MFSDTKIIALDSVKSMQVDVDPDEWLKEQIKKRVIYKQHILKGKQIKHVMRKEYDNES